MSHRLSMAMSCVVLLSACGVDLRVRAEAQIVCDDSTQCPAGRVCVATVKKCLAPGTACIESRGGAWAPVADGNACPDAPNGICLLGACTTSTCGDGYLDRTRGEECDRGPDNNDVLPDACRTDCRLPSCGDGTLDTDEQCDKGAANSLRADCLPDVCRLNVCGDGYPNLDGALSHEECDDGNDNEHDACLRSCRLNVCGDEVVHSGVEDCDDGNSNPNDGCDACHFTRWDAVLLTGTGLPTPLAVNLAGPAAVALDAAGAIYVADRGNNRVIRYDPTTGLLSRIAGTGALGAANDDGPALRANLTPQALAIGRTGEIYVADAQAPHVSIRRIDPATGMIVRIAGTGGACTTASLPCGDGGLGLDATVGASLGALALSSSGEVIFSETDTHRLRLWAPASGVISTIAGTGTACAISTGPCGDGGDPVLATLKSPTGLAIASSGEVFFSDAGDSRVRKLNRARTLISAVAGNGVACCDKFCVPASACGDGVVGGATGSVFAAGGASLAFDAAGRLLVAEANNHRVRSLDLTTLTLTTVVGGGSFCTESSCGDGGPPTAAVMVSPSSIAVAGDGGLVVSDATLDRVRRVDPARTVVQAVIGSVSGAEVPPDGRAASAVGFQTPMGLAREPAGDLLVVDQGWSRLVRVRLASGLVELVAGTARACGGACGDGGPARDAGLNWPAVVLAVANGDIYIGESAGARVRRVTGASGIINTVAGDGTDCMAPYEPCGAGGAATSASLGEVRGVALDSVGNLYVASNRNRIWRVGLDGNIAIVVGGALYCATPTSACGDGGVAAGGLLNDPHGIVIDAADNLYIADSGDHRVRKVDSGTGKISTVAGSGVPCGTPLLACGDGGAATAAQLNGPLDVALDGAGRLYIADGGTHRIRRLELDATLTTVGGSGAAAWAGDGAPAHVASLGTLSALSVAPDGTVFFTDSGVVRRISSTSGKVEIVAGNVDPPGDGLLASGWLVNPAAMVIEPLGGSVLAAVGMFAGYHRVARVRLDVGQIDSVVGYPVPLGPTGQARYTALSDARGLALDPIGDGSGAVVYVNGAAGNAISRLQLHGTASASSWTVDAYANVSGAGPGFADGPAATAQFGGPLGLAFDAGERRLVVADTDNELIRVIDATGTVTTIAGTVGYAGFFGDDVPAADALFRSPKAVAVGPDHSIYVADSGNNRVRRIDLTSSPVSIRTVLGDGSPYSGADGKPARYAGVDTPNSLFVDPLGNVFVTSRTRVRVVTPGANGVVDGGSDEQLLTVYGSARDRFPEAATACLSAIVPGATGDTVFVADACQGYLVQVTRRCATCP